MNYVTVRSGPRDDLFGKPHGHSVLVLHADMHPSRGHPEFLVCFKCKKIFQWNYAEKKWVRVKDWRD